MGTLVYMDDRYRVSGLAPQHNPLHSSDPCSGLFQSRSLQTVRGTTVEFTVTPVPSSVNSCCFAPTVPGVLVQFPSGDTSLLDGLCRVLLVVGSGDVRGLEEGEERYP